MSVTTSELAAAFADAAKNLLTSNLEKVEHCLTQLSDEQIWWRPEPEMNSIGNLLLHVNGNLRQWIVSAVGGAEDRRVRPGEFSELGPIEREKLLEPLRATIAECCAAIERADSELLLEPRRIQAMEVSVMQAAFESAAHFQGHVQEIICLTRLQLGGRYRFLWQPTTLEEGASPEAFSE